MGQIVNEPVSFTGLYVDPESGITATDDAIKDA
jgi:hypothetical protein